MATDVSASWSISTRYEQSSSSTNHEHQFRRPEAPPEYHALGPATLAPRDESFVMRFLQELERLSFVRRVNVLGLVSPIAQSDPVNEPQADSRLPDDSTKTGILVSD